MLRSIVVSGADLGPDFHLSKLEVQNRLPTPET